jgi:CDP-4-dehydro-6-deoxyglucose reductase
VSYQVTIATSGRRFLVNTDETVLEAAIRQGIGLPYGCRNGLCGTCKGKLMSGKVTYQQPPEALTDDEKAHSVTLFCQARPESDLVIHVTEINTSKDLPLKRFPAKVTGIEQLNHDVMRISLKIPEAIRFQFLAGQYIDFILKDEKRRSFSIANAPHQDTHIELHVRHIQGGRFTSEVFDKMQVNDIVRIEGPLGSFFLRENSDRPVIFIAGGTGFAPIKGIIEHALAKNIQREMHIYWGARTLQDLYMHEQAQRWADTYAYIHYIPVLSEPTSNDDWQGRTGFVHEAVMLDIKNFSAYEIYASGPPAMVYAGRDAFLPHGLKEELYYSDAFEFSND